MFTKSLTGLVDMLCLYIMFSIGFANLLWVYSCGGWWRALFILLVFMENSVREEVNK